MIVFAHVATRLLLETSPFTTLFFMAIFFIAAKKKLLSSSASRDSRMFFFFCLDSIYVLSNHYSYLRMRFHIQRTDSNPIYSETTQTFSLSRRKLNWNQIPLCSQIKCWLCTLHSSSHLLRTMVSGALHCVSSIFGLYIRLCSSVELKEKDEEKNAHSHLIGFKFDFDFGCRPWCAHFVAWTTSFSKW